MPPAYYGHATETTSAPPAKRSIKTDPKANGDFEIPVPFDSALNNNFTTSCAQFFRAMLTSETVTDCHPFSLMLQVHSPLNWLQPRLTRYRHLIRSSKHRAPLSASLRP